MSDQKARTQVSYCEENRRITAFRDPQVVRVVIEEFPQGTEVNANLVLANGNTLPKAEKVSYFRFDFAEAERFADLIKALAA